MSAMQTLLRTTLVCGVLYLVYEFGRTEGKRECIATMIRNRGEDLDRLYKDLMVSPQPLAARRFRMASEIRLARNEIKAALGAGDVHTVHFTQTLDAWEKAFAI